MIREMLRSCDCAWVTWSFSWVCHAAWCYRNFSYLKTSVMCVQPWLVLQIARQKYNKQLQQYGVLMLYLVEKNSVYY